jgi:hypothetical protein
MEGAPDLTIAHAIQDGQDQHVTHNDALEERDKHGYLEALA